MIYLFQNFNDFFGLNSDSVDSTKSCSSMGVGFKRTADNKRYREAPSRIPRRSQEKAHKRHQKKQKITSPEATNQQGNEEYNGEELVSAIRSPTVTSLI